MYKRQAESQARTQADSQIRTDLSKKIEDMDSRLVYCLQNGLPLDMDVYDLVETILSDSSIN